MVDFFSIVAGSIGIIDVCLKVGAYLLNVQRASEDVEGELMGLAQEIEELINESIREVSRKERSLFSSYEFADQQNLRGLWQQAGQLQKGCRHDLDILEQLLTDILGSNGPKTTGKIDGIRKQLRKQSKNGQLSQIRLKLSTYQASLQTLLSVLNMYINAYNPEEDAANCLQLLYSHILQIKR